MRKILFILLSFFILQLSGQQNYRVFPLRSLNTDNSEMAPVIYKNGIVFSSDKKNSILMVTTDLSNNYPYNLYYAVKKGRKFGKPTLLSPTITSRLSESSAAFTSDSALMYITRSLMASESITEIQKADTNRNGIFECNYNGKDWTVGDPFYFNDFEYDVAFPCLSKDGNTMFFASRAPEGYGGYDIYVSEKQGDSWSEPENLGSSINTQENEVFPFCHENGRLYFSSKGHNAQGLDIFYSEKRNGNWISPINLPRPFNSRDDDFGYVLSARMDTGYFSSNRRGTDDIFMFASGFPAFKECPFQQDESFCYFFSEQGSIDLDSTSMKYEWDFGDGNKVQSIESRHCYSEVGSYIVSLNVIDTLTGEIYFSEATYELLIEPIEQSYISSVDTVSINERITLDGRLSEVRSFTPVDYFWDFGDGNINSGIEIEHSYSSPGEYYIRLGITDGVESEDDSDIIPEGRVCSQKRIVVEE